MSLKQIVDKTLIPNTKHSLTKQLVDAGIDEEDIVIVHVSLSSIGWIVGGAQTLFDALYDAVGPLGTIVVPTQTMDNTDPAHWQNPAVPVEWHNTIRETMPAYHKKTTPTRGMGAFSEYVRNHPDSQRSTHPQVSFAAVGFHAKSIVKKHVLSPKFGLETPLGALYKLNKAKVLLIGVEIDKCTALHLSEALSKGNLGKEDNGCAAVLDNKRKWVTYADIDYDSDRFFEIEKVYLKSHSTHLYKIGLANAKVYDFNKLILEGISYLDEKFKH